MTARQLIDNLKPEGTDMTTTNQQPTTEPFPTDTEVTITITGKVIGQGLGSLSRRLVVEYLTASGFPDRIAVDVNSAAVTAESAPPPSPAEQGRRDSVHALIRDSHIA